MSQNKGIPHEMGFIKKFYYAYATYIWITLTCIVMMLLIAFVFDIDTIIAPIMKIITRIEVFILNTLPKWWSLLGAWFKAEIWIRAEALVLISIPSWWLFVSTWLKEEIFAWAIMKKLPRIALKSSIMSISKWIAGTFILSWLSHDERIKLKQLPAAVQKKLVESRIFRGVCHWWKAATERKKRIFWGCVVCVALSLMGDVATGIAILLIDFIWEVCLFCLAQIWRFLSWVLPQILPGKVSDWMRDHFIPNVAKTFPRIRRSRVYRYARWRIRYYKKWRILRPGIKIRQKVRKV